MRRLGKRGVVAFFAVVGAVFFASAAVRADRQAAVEGGSRGAGSRGAAGHAPAAPPLPLPGVDTSGRGPDPARARRRALIFGVAAALALLVGLLLARGHGRVPPMGWGLAALSVAAWALTGSLPPSLGGFVAAALAQLPARYFDDPSP